MTTFTLIDAKVYHCGQMARRLRHDHHEATMRVGIDAHHKLREMFDHSSYKKALYADGELVALGGVTGGLIEPFGFIWLAITENAMRKYPISLAREARRRLNDIMVTKSQVETTVIGGDEKAKRLAVYLGFHVSHGDRGEPAFTKFGRRDLCGYLDSTPELRVPIGNGFAIRLGYH